MVYILAILLVVAVIYGFGLTNMYNEEAKKTAKYYKLWEEECRNTVKHSVTIAKLRDTVGELNGSMAAKEREIDKMKDKVKEAEADVLLWRSRAERLRQHVKDNENMKISWN